MKWCLTLTIGISLFICYLWASVLYGSFDLLSLDPDARKDILAGTAVVVLITLIIVAGIVSEDAT